MEELENKTVMCSVFFLDIVGYSKKSVTGQISLKDRFNNYLSAAIRDIPITDRIILDTGDGAVINFLGDIEDALKTALSLRESLLNEDPNLNHPLLVRMGINLGPVRLVRDAVNGQPNIVGDGINVAQRVTGFADPNQILVSRSYFDVISRLSPQYADLFNYQGSRTDKHVREHEVYAISYPSDRTNPRLKKQSKKATGSTGSNLRLAASSILNTNLLLNFSRAGSVKRVVYVVLFLIVLLGTFFLIEKKLFSGDVPANNSEQTVNVPQSFSVVRPTPPPSEVSSAKSDAAISVSPPDGVQAEKQKVVVKKIQKDKPPRLEAEHKINTTTAPVREEAAETSVKLGTDTIDSGQSTGSQYANIRVTCLAGAEVFIDGSRKGKMESSSLSFPVTPGRHLVIVSHAKDMDSKIIKFKAGVTVSVNPDFCNH